VSRHYGGAGLVIGRAKGETVVLDAGTDDEVRITVVAPGRNGGDVQLAIDAPEHVEILREELLG
jgi:carbon storage regulator CsrA